MDPLYKPEGVEARWQETWEAEGLYAAGAGARRDETYVICVPPPNVTGELHMGHALNGSIQDVLVRWHRMRGFDTLWQPGYDHAGISTQNVVEKELAKEGLTRHDLGREAFVERTWEWLEKTGRTIMGQYRRLGASLDYSRERFTMDDDYVRAVMTFFVRLWERGWIYRDNRIVNWCPFHQTAISDLEVVHEEMDDMLVTVRYPFADGDGREGISVATVRPATILADVAVAVHPDDERYAPSVGREVVVPYVERRVPVIADERVDPEFGTGAVKVTPGHDPTDFAIGRRPRAPRADGRRGRRPHERGGGRSRRALPGRGGQARPRLGRGARARGGEGELPARGRHVRALPLPDRAAHLAAVVVRDEGAGRARRSRRCASGASATTRSPSTASRSPRSRSRRTGASPASSGGVTSSRSGRVPTGTSRCRSTSRPAARSAAPGSSQRESDVLDTWFSSALWPYATLGWPDDTPELARYYPGDVNSTAREIIRLWVNRMIWTGLEVLGDVPFTDSIIHSTVLAVDGRRMSKSLGTGIDPMEPIEEYGADATRYGLLKISSTQDVRFSYGAIEEGRKLAIKLWNVARLDPPARRGRGARARAARSRGALDPRAHRRRASRARGRVGALRLRRLDGRRSTTSSSTTSATGTRRRSSRGSTTTIAQPSRLRSPHSSGCSRSCTR